jgi:uncharacterized protein YxjI
MFGHRREERRAERDATHYRMRQKLVSIADTYGVEVAAGQDPPLLLAVAAVLDTMAHPER